MKILLKILLKILNSSSGHQTPQPGYDDQSYHIEPYMLNQKRKDINRRKQKDKEYVLYASYKETDDEDNRKLPV